jgi:hypothetical protein
MNNLDENLIPALTELGGLAERAEGESGGVIEKTTPQPTARGHGRL